MRGNKTSAKVLLVSKDRELGDQLHGCLSALGLATNALAIVQTEPECVTALTRMRPHVLVLDDEITNQDAQSLLRTVRQHDPEVLVVYLATHHTAALERAVRQLGVLYYTEKPPDLQLFGKILGSALASAANTPGDSGSEGEKGALQR
jgi:DNA-binding NtrC family response regulator